MSGNNKSYFKFGDTVIPCTDFKATIKTDNSIDKVERMIKEYYKVEVVDMPTDVWRILDYEDEEIMRVIDSRIAHQICDCLNRKQEYISKLEHELHSCHGLYASDQEDMSHSFQLDFSKVLK